MVNYFIGCFFLALLNICSIHCNGSLSCSRKEISTAFLDMAVDLITKAKYNIPSDCDCTLCPKNCTELPKDCPECPKCPTYCRECSKLKAQDCADLLNMGRNKSGVYEIWPILTGSKPIAVYCDMDTDGGGWTVIQRRGDFGSPKDYFYKDWKSYKEGFGEVEKDFWLGNDNIFALTNYKFSSVRFDLMDFNKTRRYALYKTFWIDNEDSKYTLHISNYSGNAGDAMKSHDNCAFSTKDRKHDRWSSNCAQSEKGGWWYNMCSSANLNGLYYNKPVQIHNGTYWNPWQHRISLAWTEIKIRPKHFEVSFA